MAWENFNNTNFDMCNFRAHHAYDNASHCATLNHCQLSFNKINHFSCNIQLIHVTPSTCNKQFTCCCCCFFSSKEKQYSICCLKIGSKKKHKQNLFHEISHWRSAYQVSRFCGRDSSRLNTPCISNSITEIRLGKNRKIW